MPRPELEPHLQRLLTSEDTRILALFSVPASGNGPFFCSAIGPAEELRMPWDERVVYAYSEGPTPEDAVYAVRQKLWNGL